MSENQILEMNKGDRLYQLHLSKESPLGEVFDVLTEMRLYIVNLIKESTEEEVIKTENSETPKE